MFERHKCSVVLNSKRLFIMNYPITIVATTVACLVIIKKIVHKMESGQC